MNLEMFKRWAWASALSVVMTALCILVLGVRSAFAAVLVGLVLTTVVQVVIILVRR